MRLYAAVINMPSRLFLLARFHAILFDSLRPLKFVSILTAIAASIGIMLHGSNDPHDDLKFLTTVMADGWWILLFLLHASVRYAGLFTDLSLKFKHATYVASCLGIWLWTMMFVGGAMLTPMEALSLLYGVGVFVEMWILGRAIYDKALDDK